MPNPLGVDLYLLHEAGKTHLPNAAAVYSAIAGQRLETVSVPDSGYWSGALTTAEGIVRDSRNNLLNAGTVLRLIAYAYAEQDSEAAAQLRKSGDMTELPHYGENGGWSDGSPSGDMEDQG